VGILIDEIALNHPAPFTSFQGLFMYIPTTVNTTFGLIYRPPGQKFDESKMKIEKKKERRKKFPYI